MRGIASVILSVMMITNLLPAQQSAADSPIRQEIAALPSASLVQIDLKDGHRLRGHIVSQTRSDFSLQREKRAGTQTIAYDQVLSVSQVKPRHSHKKWIIIGVVAGLGVAVVVVALVVVYGLSHNG